MVAYFASQFQICTGHSWNSGLFQALFKWKCANYIKNPASFDKFCFPNFKELPLIVANTTSVIPGTWTRVQSVPPVPFEFPAEHTPARRASAGHVVVISVLPQNTVIYACCPRYLLKHRCFRCNSDRTLLDNADSGPNQRFCSFSSKNIAQSHAAEWFRDQWTWRQTSQPFFFFPYIVPSSAKICWSYVVFLTFCVKQPVLRPRSFRFLVVWCVSHVHFSLSQRRERVYKYILYYILWI